MTRVTLRLGRSVTQGKSVILRGMTSEERFAAHEQWLLDHDKALTKHDEAIEEIHAVLLELAQQMTRLMNVVEKKDR